MYIVYKHKNKINNKCYIGITCRTPIERWGSYGQKYSTNRYFWKDIQKYGWNAFEHKVLAHDLTADQASRWETKLISYYNTCNPKYGYNHDAGGIKGVRELKEEDAILSTKDFKLYSSPVHCSLEIGLNPLDIVTECYKGVNENKKCRFIWLDDYNNLSKEDKNMRLYGYTFDNNLKNEIQVTNKDYLNLTFSFPVICLETKKKYNSIIECVRELKVSGNTVRAHCDGTISYKIKRKFMYLSDYEKLSDEEKEKSKFFNSDNKYQRGDNKAVVDLLNQNIYVSVTACINNTETTQYTVLNHCNGKIKGCFKRRFMYLDEYKNLSIEDRTKFSHILEEANKLKYVTLVDGKEYESIKKIRNATGVKQRTLLRHCNKEIKNLDDRLYMYSSDYEKLSNKEKEEWKIRAAKTLMKLKRDSGLPKQIVRLVDGHIFNSLKECAKECGICERTVSDSCHNKWGDRYRKFMFLEDYNKLSNKDKEKHSVSSSRIENWGLHKKIIDISDGKIYKGLRDCEKGVDRGITYIQSSCKNKLQKVRRFLYLDEYNNLSVEKQNELKGIYKDYIINKDKYNVNNISIIFLPQRIEYYSIKECAFSTKYNMSTIIKHCKKSDNKSNKLFMYLKEFQTLTVEKQNKICIDAKNFLERVNDQRVIRLVDKKIYKNIEECAVDNNVKKESIRSYCSHSKKFMFFVDYKILKGNNCG